MMRWSTINPVLIALVSDLLRKPAAPTWEAEWIEQREANRMISPEQGGALYLKVTTCAAIGWDENRFEMQTRQVDGVPVTDLFEVTSGLRRFTMQVQAWESEHTDAHWAFETLETLRTRLDRTSSRERLLAVNVNLEEMLASRKMTQTIGSRRWSIGTMDMVFTAAFDEFDPVPTGWIERVILTTHAQESDGVHGDVELPFPPNVLNERLPP